MKYDTETPKIQVDHVAVVICPSCKGTGCFYGRDGCIPITCAYCRGDGKVLEPSYSYGVPEKVYAPK